MIAWVMNFEHAMDGTNKYTGNIEVERGHYKSLYSSDRKRAAGLVTFTPRAFALWWITGVNRK